ncbi:MAG: hypothetical protein PUD50_06345, partial [Eubacteriales bacterium]|nr:hypothetical protein [Eubacteriales bacterium]
MLRGTTLLGAKRAASTPYIGGNRRSFGVSPLSSAHLEAGMPSFAPRAFQPENALSAHAVTTTILPHYAHVYCILPRDNLQVNFSSFPRFI